MLSSVAETERAICSSGRARKMKKDVPGEREFARSSVAFMVVTEETVDVFVRWSVVVASEAVVVVEEGEESGGWRPGPREVCPAFVFLADSRLSDNASLSPNCLPAFTYLPLRSVGVLFTNAIASASPRRSHS